MENFPQPLAGKARDQAAASVNVSGRTVDKASKVLEHGSPELIKDVEEGRVTVNKAEQIIRKNGEKSTSTKITDASEAKGTAKEHQVDPKTAKQRSKAADALTDCIDILRRIPKDNPFVKTITFKGLLDPSSS